MQVSYSFMIKRESRNSESFGRMFLYVDFIDTVDKIVKAI